MALQLGIKADSEETVQSLQIKLCVEHLSRLGGQSYDEAVDDSAATFEL